GTLYGGEVMDAAGSAHLPPELRDRAVEDSDERTWPELIGDRSHILHALRLAKRAHKPQALRASPAEQPPLRENHSPRDHAEGDQKAQDTLGGRAGLRDEVYDIAADKKKEARRNESHELERTLTRL